MDLNDSFTLLLKRQPTDEEKQRLYDVKKALGIKDNDSIWLIIMAMQSYQTYYERIPKQIVNASNYAIENVKEASAIAIRESTEKAKAELSKAVADTATKIARDTATAKKAAWGAGLVVTVILSLLIAGGAGYYAGYRLGTVHGYEQSRDERAAANWANTPEGREAYQLAQARIGNIENLARCSSPGWEVRTTNDARICFPLPSADGKLNGWFMP